MITTEQFDKWYQFMEMGDRETAKPNTNWSSALKIYKHARKLLFCSDDDLKGPDPRSAHCWGRMATCYEKLEKWNRAIECYNLALTLPNKDRPPKQKQFIYCVMCYIAFRLDDSMMAQNYFSNLVDTLPHKKPKDRKQGAAHFLYTIITDEYADQEKLCLGWLCGIIPDMIMYCTKQEEMADRKNKQKEIQAEMKRVADSKPVVVPNIDLQTQEQHDKNLIIKKLEIQTSNHAQPTAIIQSDKKPFKTKQRVKKPKQQQNTTIQQAVKVVVVETIPEIQKKIVTPRLRDESTLIPLRPLAVPLP